MRVRFLDRLDHLGLNLSSPCSSFKVFGKLHNVPVCYFSSVKESQKPVCLCRSLYQLSRTMQRGFVTFICIFNRFFSLGEDKLHTLSRYNNVVPQRGQNSEEK